MKHFLDSLCEQVETAARQGTPLRPSGSGSKDFYGGPLIGEVIDMRPHQGIVEYEPTELVMTARAGTPLAEIEAALAKENQELAFEPPRFSKHSTIGGVVCAGLAGPARLAKGPVKDYILGCNLIDGRGQLLHFGGTVMKNVAGYDVSRVVPGSLGTLGIVTELSIKVMPKAAAETTLTFEMSQAEAIAKANDWLGRSLPISATCWQSGKLLLRLRGARAAVSSAINTLGGERMNPEDATQFWNNLRDQKLEFFASAQELWRISVPPTSQPLNLEGEQLIEWAGGQRWLKRGDQLTESAIRAAAKIAGGHATLYRSPLPQAERTSVFELPSKPLLAIQQRLKKEFDPAEIFSQRRLAPIL